MSAVDTLLSLGKVLVVDKDAYGKICVEYQMGWIKDGCMLIGDCGRGESFDEACRDYVRKIQGKTLVFTNFGEKREEVKVLFVRESDVT